MYYYSLRNSSNELFVFLTITRCQVLTKTYPMRILSFYNKIYKHVSVNDLYCPLPLFLHYSTFVFKVLINNICCSRVIWLGDLNYRIALSYRAAKALVEMQNWRALLENDQARFTYVLHIFCCQFPSSYFKNINQFYEI